MVIAVLALQGAFIEHEQMLEKLGAETFELRQKSDLKRHFDGLIIPGGESTVQGKLLRELDMYDELKKMIAEGLPVFGTCAGLILLAKKLSGSDVSHFALMDIEAKRNAYGRQLGSFRTEENFGSAGKIPMTFIRAPYIEKVWGDTEILAETKGHIVAARQKNMLVTAFHPELDSSHKVHSYFLDMVKNNMK